MGSPCGKYYNLLKPLNYFRRYHSKQQEKCDACQLIYNEGIKADKADKSYKYNHSAAQYLKCADLPISTFPVKNGAHHSLTPLTADELNRMTGSIRKGFEIINEKYGDVSKAIGVLDEGDSTAEGCEAVLKSIESFKKGIGRFKI